MKLILCYSDPEEKVTKTKIFYVSCGQRRDIMRETLGYYKRNGVKKVYWMKNKKETQP